MRKEYLKIENGIKLMDGKPKLFSIYLTIFQNQINGIITKRKSEMFTIFDILTGLDRFTYGRVYYREVLFSNGGETSFLKDHITIINEVSGLVENLSIAENIFVVRDTGRQVFVDLSNMERKAKYLLNRFEVDISIDRPVGSLSNFERCQIEMLKAFINDAELVLLDFRLNDFTDSEQESFLALATRLKKNGMTFLLFGYVVQTLLYFTDTLTLISDGKTVGIFDRDEYDADVVYRLLIGHTMGLGNRMENVQSNVPAALKLQGITSDYLEDASLTIRKGEIVYLVYTEQKGGKELQDILCGMARQKSGDILVNGKRWKPKDTYYAIRHGVVTIGPENGLFPNMNVFDNLALAKGGELKRIWWSKRYCKSLRQYLLGLFGRDVSDCSVFELTEEERYILLYHRWLLYRPDVTIFINPLSTVNIQMSLKINELIRLFARQGSGVLILTQNSLITDAMNMSVYKMENQHIKFVRNR